MRKIGVRFFSINFHLKESRLFEGSRKIRGYGESLSELSQQDLPYSHGYKSLGVLHYHEEDSLPIIVTMSARLGKVTRLFI